MDVDETGLITSSHEAGTAYIFVSDSTVKSSSLRFRLLHFFLCHIATVYRLIASSESVIMKVVVKPVHHLSLAPVPPVALSLPVGTSYKFDLVLRDEMGLPFHSYDSGISRSSVVDFPIL